MTGLAHDVSYSHIKCLTPTVTSGEQGDTGH